MKNTEVPKDSPYVLTYYDEEEGMAMITGDCPVCHQFPCKHIDTSQENWGVKKPLRGKDRGMEKRKLRERIRDFIGWDKDADDILGVIEMQAGGCYQLLIPFGSYGNIRVEERGREDTCYFYFPFCSQCEKLEAFKKACHWVLDFGVKNGKADRCSGQNERNS